MSEDEPEDETVTAAAAAAAERLYAAAPDEFMALRTELVRAAKADGEPEAAKAIEKLRKPTLPASIVNLFAHANPDEVAKLSELGDRLRRATRDLDATLLRELSTERRGLVADLTKAALRQADAPTTQRDEVSSTFDAAVADPDVAARLGRLLRPESFSGFGVAPGPDLTLVQGGSVPRPAKKTTTTRAAAKKAPVKKAPARRLVRAAEKARDAFAAADQGSTAAEADEKRAHEAVTRLTDELDQLQHELDEAKRELDRARKQARTAKAKRREARSALDRAERQLEP